MTFLTPSPIAAFRALPAGTVPPLFSQCNVRKHEYWQFAKLIAPASELPEGKKVWTTDDAIGIWCLKCAKALPYQKGSSQSIRYHMETKHMADLRAFRDKLNRIKCLHSKILI
uniref:BED-type domain-containing protein n=1 Tax=Globisporangium ultimum (strain ATCC 200006 / CBS 805.95 / DAOM BR144) TaxID=431595 RepID=K3WLR3_GLOUD